MSRSLRLAGAVTAVLAAAALSSCGWSLAPVDAVQSPQKKADRPDAAAQPLIGFPMSKVDWMTEDVETPRFGADGRSIYYVVWLRSQTQDDTADILVAAAPSIEATPAFVDAASDLVPVDVAAAARNDGSRRLSYSSPGGRYTALLAQDGSSGDTTVTISDRDSRPLEALGFGMLWIQIGWLDDQRLAISREGVGITALDVKTGRSKTIFAADSGTDIERMAVAPGGLVLFSVCVAQQGEPDDVYDLSPDYATLYSYDSGSGRLTKRGLVATGDSWDYNPSTGAVLYVPYDRTVIVHVPLEQMQ